MAEIVTEQTDGWEATVIEFEYKFKRAGGSAPGTHCTYCPKQPGEICQLPCLKNYDALLEERKADGILVNDEP